jgi:hypothetical protein
VVESFYIGAVTKEGFYRAINMSFIVCKYLLCDNKVRKDLGTLEGRERCWRQKGGADSGRDRDSSQVCQCIWFTMQYHCGAGSWPISRTHLLHGGACSAPSE